MYVGAVAGQLFAIKTAIPVCGGRVYDGTHAVHCHQYTNTLCLPYPQGAEAAADLKKEALVSQYIAHMCGGPTPANILGVIGEVEAGPILGYGIVLPYMEGGNCWQFWQRCD